MAYTPTSMPGVLGWWSANASTAAEGSQVLVYPKGMNTSPDLSETSPNTKPLLRKKGFNTGAYGVETFADSGGGNAFSTNSYSLLDGATALTMFGTFRLGTDTEMDAEDMTVAGWELKLKLGILALKPRLLISSNGTSWISDGWIGPTALTKGVNHYYIVMVGGGTATVIIDGQQVISQPFSGPIATKVQTLSLASANDIGAYPFQGLVGEFGVGSQRLSGTDLTNLQDYLVASMASQPLALAGAATATSRSAGAIVRRAPLSGAATAWTDASGHVALYSDISGQGFSSGSASGAVGARLALAGAATATSNAVGALRNQTLSAVATAQSTASGAVIRRLSLAGAASAASVASTADLGYGRPLAAAASVSSYAIALKIELQPPNLIWLGGAWHPLDSLVFWRNGRWVQMTDMVVRQGATWVGVIGEPFGNSRPRRVPLAARGRVDSFARGKMGLSGLGLAASGSAETIALGLDLGRVVGPPPSNQPNQFVNNFLDII